MTIFLQHCKTFLTATSLSVLSTNRSKCYEWAKHVILSYSNIMDNKIMLEVPSVVSNYSKRLLATNSDTVSFTNRLSIRLVCDSTGSTFKVSTLNFHSLITLMRIVKYGQARCLSVQPSIIRQPPVQFFRVSITLSFN